MQELITADTYLLLVDTIKNRIYFSIIKDDISWDATFVQDWENAVHLVSKGFTVLADISLLQHMTRNWVAASMKLQQMLVEAGLAGTAEVLSEDVVTKLQISRFIRLSKLRYTKEELFTNRRMAEAWLDRIQPKITERRKDAGDHQHRCLQVSS